MEKISFKRNYNNKLANEYLITIREKSDKWKLGNVYELYDQDIACVRGHGKIVQIKELTIHDLNDWLTFLDAAMPTDQFVSELVSFYGPEIVLKRLQMLLIKRVSIKPIQQLLF